MAKEKLRIIEEAVNIGNHAAGRKYDVSERYIRDWHEKQNATYRNKIVIIRHFAAKKRGIRSLRKG